MKMLSRNVIGTAFAISLILGFVVPNAAFAATTPSLGAAATYGLLSTTYVDPVTPLASTINGDAGFTIAPAQAPGGAQTNYGSGAPYAAAGGDQGTALTALNGLGQGCTVIAGPLNAVIIGANPPGVFPPGCYEMAPAMLITVSTSVTLDLTAPGGVGSTWIFKSTGGGLTTGADSFITLANGASACDVFWAPVGATSIGAYTGALPNVTKLFVGTIIDDAGISLGENSSLLGRALAFASSVTLGNNATINVPVCAIPPTSGGTRRVGTINVVKTVINDNGGTDTVADFPLFVNSASVVSGETNSFSARGEIYTITEPANAQYTQSFSGDCDSTGRMTLSQNENKFCIVTNDDIGPPIATPPVPPLIDVVKVPSPLALPDGPGSVTYTYTLRNIGTVPVTNVTMVGDTCSPIVRVSGDINNNSQLEVSETWVHRCTTTLTETHTNTVVATGWANGLSAVDIASATVVVGLPVVPPLIHVTKVPRPRALLAGGGMVTYVERITNPGTVPLSNVRLVDNKCSPMRYISGDRNRDGRLDPNERWTYTCRSNITQTTVNTAIASGEANGLTVRDFAIATVVVADAIPTRPAAPVSPAPIPSLPNTGFPPVESSRDWYLRFLAPLGY